MLGTEIEGRLHKTVWLADGKTMWSVSRVNEWLSFFFILFWIGITLYAALGFVGLPWLNYLRHLPIWLQLSLITAPITLGAIMLVCQKSRIPGALPKEDGSHGERFEQRSCWCKRTRESRTFIRRYAPDEFPR